MTDRGLQDHLLAFAEKQESAVAHLMCCAVEKLDYLDKLEAEVERLKRANVHDCANVQTVIDGRQYAEADNTRLRVRVSELEANLAAAHHLLLHLEKDREVWRRTAQNRYDRIAELENELTKARENYSACVIVHGLQEAQKRYDELVARLEAKR